MPPSLASDDAVRAVVETSAVASVGNRGSGGGVREPSAAHFAPVAGGMAFRASERRHYA